MLLILMRNIIEMVFVMGARLLQEVWGIVRNSRANARLNIYCFNAVIGTTYTPSGLLYAAFVNPQIIQRTDGTFPFSASI